MTTATDYKVDPESCETLGDATESVNWKSKCHEIVPELFYVSTKNLTDEPWFEAASKEARFVELVKATLRNSIYETTDYFGPLTTVEVLSLKPFFRLHSDAPLCIYVPVIPNNEIPQHSTEAQHQENEYLANLICLLSCCLVLFRNWTPEDAIAPFYRHFPQIYRFHGIQKNELSVSIFNCLEALYKAKRLKMITAKIHPEDLTSHISLNIDLDWIIPRKLLAFAAPTSPASAARFLSYFQRYGVTSVIRLSEDNYDASVFTENGIRLLDVPYIDGRVPSSEILFEVLNFMLESPGAIAVHCKSGIGRTGTVICAYIMKEYKFTAQQAIAFCRLQRPGSVNGAQHVYLLEKEHWLLGLPANELLTELPPYSKVTLSQANLDSAIKKCFISGIASFPLAQWKILFESLLHRFFYDPPPLSLPPNFACEITDTQFLYYVENLMCCGRLDINKQ